VPGQVLLTSADLEHRASYLNARNTLERLLALGAVPVINENDTTATDELTFGDNDVLAAQVAILLRARLLLLLTDRDGLYAPGPDGPVRIAEVPAGTAPDDVRLADLPGSGRGRGGIASKLASAAMATGCGVTCVIASGEDDGVIAAAVAGEHVGTRFVASGRAEGAFKMWLRHAKPAQGRVVVDAGAVRALIDQGCDVICQHTDSPAPLQLANERGVFGFGQASDMTRFAPRAHLTSSVNNCGLHSSMRASASLPELATPTTSTSGMSRSTFRTASTCFQS
jgi:glutamate 5-kinase